MNAMTERMQAGNEQIDWTREANARMVESVNDGMSEETNERTNEQHERSTEIN